VGVHPVGFPIALQLRPLTPEEHDTIRQLAQSRPAAARTVERAKIIWLASRGRRVPTIAAEVRLGGDTVRLWLKRFNADGLAGLRDRPRAGRPATYTTEQAGEVVALSLTDPRRLGLPFASWTLDRLRAYLHEVKGLPISRARIGKLLVAEGLRWRTQETWFGERVDPAFAEKRGPSSRSTSRSTRPRLRVVSSSASTRWGRRGPRAFPAAASSRR
jgi:transposase